MTYTCIVVEDNIIERRLLCAILKEISILNIKGDFSNGWEASTFLTDNTVDIVFCDIDMPKLNGIDLLKSLRKPPIFIFTTAHKDYAVESFDLDVLDYLSKPLTFDRVLKSVNKAIEYLRLKEAAALNVAAVADRQSATDDHFFIKENQGITKLKYADVVFVESLGNFSKIHTFQPEPNLVLTVLKNLEAQMPATIFKRVHKQYLVNLNYVNAVTATEVQLSNKHCLPLGSLYRQQLLDAFLNKEVIKRNI